MASFWLRNIQPNSAWGLPWAGGRLRSPGRLHGTLPVMPVGIGPLAAQEPIRVVDAPPEARTDWTWPVLVVGACLLSGCLDGEASRSIGEAAGGCAVAAQPVAELGLGQDSVSLTQPFGVSVAGTPEMGWFILDSDVRRVMRYDLEGRLLGSFVQSGQGPEELPSTVTMTIDPSGLLWVSAARGRAVGYDRSGTPLRSISRPDLLPIDGYSPGGVPFSVRVAVPLDASGEPAGPSRGYAVVFGPGGDGDRTYVGPGARYQEGTEMGAQFLSSRVGGGPQVSALEDSLFLAWNYGDREVLFSMWTPVGAEAWGFRDDILGALGLDPDSPDGRAALPGGIRNTANGVWALVSLRREHDAQVEDELRLSASRAIGGREGPRSPVVTYAPGVRNRLYDGGIVWMDLDGQPVAGTILPEDARGFVDDRHVFTLAESDDGVLIVRIWEFEGVCPAS